MSELFSSLQQSVIVIKSGEPTTSLSTGFFVSSDGLVIVPSFALSKEPFFVEIPRIGKSMLAEVIKRDDQKSLALLKIKLADPVVPIEKFSNKIELGDQVVALGYAGASGWISTVGRITGDVKGHTGSNRVASDIETKPGMAGAPVINTKGELVGIAESRDAQGTCVIDSSYCCQRLFRTDLTV